MFNLMALKNTNDAINELDIYFKEIKKYKSLSKEEEYALIKKIKNGDKASLNKLINANLKFVVNIAKGYRRDNIPFNDLISEGNLALLKAVEKFDETKNVKFISYAVWWIRYYIQAFIDNYNKGMINITDTYNYVTNTTSDNLESYDVNNTDAINANFEDKMILLQDQQDSINKLSECLQERERKILMLYFGMSNDNKENTLDEISKKMNITKERVRQIKDKALIKLRINALSSGYFNEYQLLI